MLLNSVFSSVFSYFFSSGSPFWRRWGLGILVGILAVSLHWLNYAVFFCGGHFEEFREVVLESGEGLSSQGIFPVVDPDGGKWLTQVLHAFRGGDWSLSISAIDAVSLENGATPVYWSRGYFFFLGGLTWVFLLFGIPLEQAVVFAGFLSGPLLLFLGVILVSGLALRILPGVWGLFLVPMVFFEPKVEACFSAFLPDHHGMIGLFFMLWFLCFFLPSGRAWLYSGIFLGVSLWMSVLTIIPLLGLFGLGALVSCACGVPWVRDALIFRKWGLVAGGVALLFWVFDYLLVGRAGMRLEVVHPLWCLAIWGGGELLCRISLFLEGRSQPGFFFSGSAGLGWVLACFFIVAPIFSIVYSSGAWFWPAYPWVSSLMKGIVELQPVSMSLILLATGLLPFFLFFGICLLWGRSWMSGLGLMGILAYSLLAFQSRWLFFATFLGVFGLLMILSEISKNWGKLGFWVEGESIPLWFSEVFLPRICVGVLLIGGFSVFLPNLVSWVNLGEAREKFFSSGGMFDTTVDSARLAGVLGSDFGGEGFVMLGPPDVGTQVAYYGNSRSVGSMYWEAWRGLKDTTAFWGSKMDFQSIEILEKYGVDYVVFATDRLSYFSDDGVLEGETLQDRLLKGEHPDWLVPLEWESISKIPMKVFKVDRSKY